MNIRHLLVVGVLLCGTFQIGAIKDEKAQEKARIHRQAERQKAKQMKGKTEGQSYKRNLQLSLATQQFEEEYSS